VTYQFRFKTSVGNPNTFLYNTGPVTSPNDPDLNVKQTYTLTRTTSKGSQVLVSGAPVLPANVGPRSNPSYDTSQGIADLGDGRRAFAGPRDDPFFVDLGSIFDLGALRPFQDAHLIPLSGVSNDGRDSLRKSNVHTIAIEVPITTLTSDGNRPSDPMASNSVIGVWTAASRQKGNVLDGQGGCTAAGPFTQVSRLGNPLFNEVIVPMGDKDHWNAVSPDQDAEFAKYVSQPELAKLLPILYPGVFPNLEGYSKDRADLLAILMTGIPAGVVPGFQNYTGAVQADYLRLNVAIPPSGNENPLGLVAGDAAGFPNGRRLLDDVVTIELRAIAGLTIPLVDPSFTPDGATSAIQDGSYNAHERITLPSFPYVGPPHSGYRVPGE